MASSDVSDSASLPIPGRLFPLVRQLSRRLTPLLLRLPLTANHVTLASIAVGLAACACFAAGAPVAGALLFLLCQVLDSCDGEVARHRGVASCLGRHLDAFGDWLVHSLLWIAIGFALGQAAGRELWLWLGVIAASGTTANSVLGFFTEEDAPSEKRRVLAAAREPARTDKALYTFHVLLDEDFCFVLVAFALADALWLLLPSAAIGTHAHWLAGLWAYARRSKG